MKLPTTAVSALAALLSAQVNAQAYTEHRFEEFPIGSPTFYVDCIGGDLFAPLTARANYQLTVTPSGRIHATENWQVYGIWTSSDGYEWSAFGQGPYFRNLQQPGDSQVVVREKLKVIASPLDDNPYPKLETGYEFKFVQDANGEIQIDRFSDYPFVCLGNAP